MYYAAQRPRGFQNETIIYRFDRAVERDNWIWERESVRDSGPGDAPFKINAARARYLVRGDEWRDEMDAGGVYTSRY